jgi:hypothetical protein
MSVCLAGWLPVRPSARPPARVEKLGCQWTDVNKIWYLGLFRNSIEKIQVSLKYDMNNGYFT